jgi:N-acetylmuramoyl-L-alanine amidase
MRFAAQLLGLLLMLEALPAKAAAISSTRVWSSGRDYVRLNDWARANRFVTRWLSPNKTLQLSNRVARLVFTADARQDRTKAWINDVEVSLTAPILYQNGSAFIAQRDLNRTIGPILNPPKNAAGDKIKTICIDPGHGGKDPGFRVGGNSEKKYTLLLAQEVRGLLQQAGFEVVLTRSSDIYVDREDRPELAKRRRADLFLSLHFNAFNNSLVKGIETYCLTPAGAYSSNSGGEGDTRSVGGNRKDENNMLLAYQLHRSLIRTLKAEDRGIKRARFEVLRLSTVPAVLIEGGFMSNPGEGRKIFDPAYRKQMARAIVDGIQAYKKAVNG